MAWSTYCSYFCTETFQKPLLETFCYNNKGTRKVKNFRTLSNKGVLQLNGWKETIFSVLIFGGKFLLFGLLNAMMVNLNYAKLVSKPSHWEIYFSYRWHMFKNSTDTFGDVSQASFLFPKESLYEIYDKINKLWNFKHNLVSRFNNLQGNATELGSKDTFLRTWYSLLNYNWSLNIQFNLFSL